MRIDNWFKFSNRGRRREAARVRRHERRTKNREVRGHFVNPGAEESWPRVETIVSQAPRAVDVPLRVLVGARVLGASLDNKLAAGRGPETSELLAARAQLIVSKARRRKLADNWLALLVEARNSSGRGAVGVPPLRDRVNDANALIHTLVDALLAPLPTSRGVAMANSLLSDGTGPIYHRASSADLVSTLRDVIRRLDPTRA
ncbi:MAG TPA: hypothetical protein VGZ04_06805 [Acidimicrobiales bacterium]|jgi:hypothetical protein|nr:hypothetical protein [Acidimicrobiales bacterium]